MRFPGLLRRLLGVALARYPHSGPVQFPLHRVPLAVRRPVIGTISVAAEVTASTPQRPEGKRYILQPLLKAPSRPQVASFRSNCISQIGTFYLRSSIKYLPCPEFSGAYAARVIAV